MITPIISIKLFENKMMRSQYDADKEMWYLSIIDIVGILTEQPNVERSRKYWKVLKSTLKKEGNELATNCIQLKMQTPEEKLYKTDVAETEQPFRLIQSNQYLLSNRNL